MSKDLERRRVAEVSGGCGNGVRRGRTQKRDVAAHVKWISGSRN